MFIKLSSRALPIVLLVFSSLWAAATLAAAKNPPASSSQKQDKKEPALHWNPPQVDAPVPSLSAAPLCSLPDVLEQAGQRAEELIDHLQNFNAHEQIHYEQTDRFGIPEMSIDAKFDYLVDFGKQSEVLKVHETRTPLEGTDYEHLSDIVDTGLPALALIFYPALQSDYEIRCEGFTPWNNQPAWVVYFSQIKGKRPRTLRIGTPTKVYPVSLKGRAWIAANSGRVMLLEANLVEGIPMIKLQADAVSVDYAPVKFQSQDVEIWLPQSAVVYTDFGERRLIIQHIFPTSNSFLSKCSKSFRSPRSRERNLHCSFVPAGSALFSITVFRNKRSPWSQRRSSCQFPPTIRCDFRFRASDELHTSLGQSRGNPRV
jgi:hypothetical protein